MKHKTQTLFPISLMLGLFLIFTPSTILTAQEEEGSVEEIFWGDEEEDEGLDEEFDFSEDEELGEEDLGGFEFEDEGFDDEFSDDDEFGDDFSEDFSDEPEESMQETASRLGYTLNLIGSSPSFVNHQLSTYNSGMDFRATFEFPMLLEMGPFRLCRDP